MKYSLIGVDGNAFCIMNYVSTCMKKEDKTDEEVNAYFEKATRGDYHELVCVSQDMIEKLNQN